MVVDLPLTNPLAALLDKPREAFTRQDMLKVVAQKQIAYFTLHYTALDGQLKELRLPFGDLGEAERILAHAEVGYIESVRSDRPMLAGKRAEQHEVESQMRSTEDMGDRDATGDAPRSSPPQSLVRLKLTRGRAAE